MNPKYHLLVAAAALSLGACSTDDTHTGPENGAYKISFTVAEDSETRTTLSEKDVIEWTPDDKVGIYTVGPKNVNTNTLTVADVNQSPVEFLGVLENSVSKGDMFYAYYPYDAEQSTDPTKVQLSIPAEQTQAEAGVYNGQTHPLVAVPMAFKWENESHAGRISSVRFRLLGAIVELQLYSSDEMFSHETIQSVTFVSDAPLAGDFTFNLKDVTVEDEPQISGYKLTEVKTLLEEPADIPAEDGKAARVYLTIAPGAYTGKFVVTTNVAHYTFTLAQPITFKRAVIKGLPADLARAKFEIINLDAPIPFKDDNVKQICVENWDTNGDKELSYGEAAAVESIGLHFQTDQKTSIGSFNELRYFTGLKSIGDNAFYGCSGLTSITIPDGVTTIGQLAFYNCTSLKSITIPQTVTSISGGAFAGCLSLSAFSGKYATEDKCCLIQDGTLLAFAPAGQTKYTIPTGVTKIGEHAFEYCYGLTSINIPNVTAIGDYAFKDCIYLTSINIPDVTAIGIYAFANCISLTSIDIPNATAIGNYIFADCSSLESITIPGVTKIGERAFKGCSKLTSITIPNKVTEIKEYTFEGCVKLTNIQLPDELTKIEDYTFKKCSSLKSITIPNKVTAIGKSAFAECSSLESIQLPNELTTINSEVFKKCSSLKSITIPDNVTEIGSDAFNGCSNLKSIQLPNKLETIKTYAFAGCSSLVSITIPDQVATIGQYCFRYCSNLESVYCKPTVPPTLELYAFNDTPSLTKIYVPADSFQAYIEAERWKTYESKIVAYDSSAGE